MENIILSIATSILTAVLTTITFLYVRVKVYRMLWGPAKRDNKTLKIQRPNGSNKVFIVNPKRKTKRWIHPKTSLERLGYDASEDVEQVEASSLKNYREKTDINLTY